MGCQDLQMGAWGGPSGQSQVARFGESESVGLRRPALTLPSPGVPGEGENGNRPLTLSVEAGGGGLIEEPEVLAGGGVDQLDGEALGVGRGREDFVEAGGFGGAGGEEPDLGGAVDEGGGEGDAPASA